MRVTFCFVLVLLFLISLSSCGGGGGGDDGGNGGDGTIDDQILGLWQAISVREGDVILPIGTFLGWESSWTKQTIEFFENGSCFQRSYIGANLALTENGTFTAQNQVGSVTFASDTLNFNYGVWWDGGEPWVTVINYPKNEHQITVSYARVVSLTNHNPDLIRTWLVSTTDDVDTVTLDGDPMPVRQYFNMQPESDTMTIQYLADGTFLMRELQNFMIVNRATGSWATGGGTIFTSIEGMEMHGLFDSGGWNMTLMDESRGKTALIKWKNWAPPGTHPTQLCYGWRAVSVTEDGNPIPLETYFEWESGVTSLVWVFWNDGTTENRHYADSNLFSAELGQWVVQGPFFMVNFGVLLNATYLIVGDNIILTSDVAGHDYVLTFTKIS